MVIAPPLPALLPPLNNESTVPAIVISLPARRAIAPPFPDIPEEGLERDVKLPVLIVPLFAVSAIAPPFPEIEYEFRS